jgi:thiol:disulfide interchange protein DsbD
LRIAALALVALVAFLAACSRAPHRPRLVEVSAAWCAACRVLERDALADRGVIAELARFDVVRVDATDDASAASALGVDVLPTLIATDSGGRETRLVGTRSATALASELRAIR